jgi:hypothetical protein
MFPDFSAFGATSLGGMPDWMMNPSLPGTATDMLAGGDPFAMPAGGMLGGVDPNNLGMPVMASGDAPIDPVTTTSGPLTPGGGLTMPNQDQFLKALSGVKMPAAPAAQAPPSAPAAPTAKTIPGGLQQLLAMLGTSGGAGAIPGLGRGL